MKKQTKSRKKFLLPLAVLTASLSMMALPALAGCNNGDPGSDPGIVTPTEDEVVVTINTAANGAVTADATTYKKGDDVTLTITPANGYRLKSITVNSQDKTSSVSAGKLVLSNVQEAAITVSAVFEAIPVPATVSVSVNDDTFGTATLDRTECLVGDTVYVTLSPATGCEVTAVMVGSLDVYDISKVTDGKLAVEVKDAATEIRVQFAKIIARLGLTTNDTAKIYGEATCEKTEYEIGETAVININVKEGGELYSLKVNGVDKASEVSEGKLEIPMEKKGRVTVVAEFGIKRIDVTLSLTAKRFQENFNIKGKTVTFTNVANSNISYTETISDTNAVEIEKFAPGTYTVAVDGCVNRTVEIGEDTEAIVLSVAAFDTQGVDQSDLANGVLTPSSGVYWCWTLDNERLGNEFEASYTVIAPNHADNISTVDYRRQWVKIHFYNDRGEEVTFARWDICYGTGDNQGYINRCPEWSNAPCLTSGWDHVMDFNAAKWTMLETDGINFRIIRGYNSITLILTAKDGTELGRDSITSNDIKDLNCRIEFMTEINAAAHRYENVNVVDTTPEYKAVTLSDTSEYDKTKGDITVTGGFGTAVKVAITPKEGNIVTAVELNGVVYKIPVTGGTIDLGYWDKTKPEAVTANVTFRAASVRDITATFENIKNLDVTLVDGENKETQYKIVNGVLTAQNFAEGVYTVKYSIFGKQYIKENIFIGDGAVVMDVYDAISDSQSAQKSNLSVSDNALDFDYYNSNGITVQTSPSNVQVGDFVVVNKLKMPATELGKLKERMEYMYITVNGLSLGVDLWTKSTTTGGNDGVLFGLWGVRNGNNEWGADIDFKGKLFDYTSGKISADGVPLGEALIAGNLSVVMTYTASTGAFDAYITADGISLCNFVHKEGYLEANGAVSAFGVNAGRAWGTTGETFIHYTMSYGTDLNEMFKNEAAEREVNIEFKYNSSKSDTAKINGSVKLENASGSYDGTITDGVATLTVKPGTYKVTVTSDKFALAEKYVTFAADNANDNKETLNYYLFGDNLAFTKNENGLRVERSKGKEQIFVNRNVSVNSTFKVTFYRAEEVGRRYRIILKIDGKDMVIDLNWLQDGDSGIQIPGSAWSLIGHEQWGWGENNESTLTGAEKTAFEAGKGITLEVIRNGGSFVVKLGYTNSEGVYSSRTVQEYTFKDDAQQYANVEVSQISFFIENGEAAAKYDFDIVEN